MRYELIQFKRLMTGRATLSNIEKSLVAGLGVYALILISNLSPYPAFTEASLRRLPAIG